MYPIQVQNLKKAFGAVQAVDDVSFNLNDGEILGLIGPDGAGKTTILRSIVTLLEADSGKLHFQGREITSHAAFVRRHIGYMPQRFSLYQDLTVQQNLRFFGDLFNVSRKEQEQRMEELYRFSNLGSFKNRKAGNLSGGMKQKLALSCMLMHEPRVMVLDEPTFGVDPVSRSEFWDILHRLSEGGISLLVTTAYMDEARQCNRVGLMHEGHMLALNTPDRLIESLGIDIYLVRTSEPHKVYKAFQDTSFANDVQLFGNGLHFLDRKQIGLDVLKEKMAQINITYKSVESIKPDLENVFLNFILSGDDRAQ